MYAGRIRQSKLEGFDGLLLCSVEEEKTKKKANLRKSIPKLWEGHSKEWNGKSYHKTAQVSRPNSEFLIKRDSALYRLVHVTNIVNICNICVQYMCICQKSRYHHISSDLYVWPLRLETFIRRIAEICRECRAMVKGQVLSGYPFHVAKLWELQSGCTCSCLWQPYWLPWALSQRGIPGSQCLLAVLVAGPLLLITALGYKSCFFFFCYVFVKNITRKCIIYNCICIICVNTYINIYIHKNTCKYDIIGNLPAPNWGFPFPC